jgi:membrane AbrB-like protein
VLVALLVGAVGGAFFAWARLPLPWLLGAMFATTAAALRHAKVHVPAPLRDVMLAAIGVMLGSRVTPEAARRLSEWPVTLAAVAVYVALAGGASYLFLRRLGGYDPVTSFFAGMPGGINEMVVVGSEMGGDERALSLIHAIRVLLVVAVVAIWFRWVGGYNGNAGVGAMSHLADIGGIELVLLVVAGVIGALGGLVFRLPAAFMLGPMIASAAFHLAGWTPSRPPAEISAVAQIVLGSALGCRFSGAPLRIIRGALWKGAVATLLGLSFALLAGVVLKQLIRIPASVVLLAFAPGGIAEMTLVAFGLGIDVAFVTVHHLARVVIVFVFAPLFFRGVARWLGWTVPRP